MSMDKLIVIFLTAGVTILGGSITFAITHIFEERYLKPYFRFKDKLTELKINLLFHKNILTNAFHRESTTKGYIEEIFKIKDSVRKDWAEVISLYRRSPKCRCPSSKEIEKITNHLLFISNSSLLFERDDKPKSINEECAERENKITEILGILNKYT